MSKIKTILNTFRAQEENIDDDTIKLLNSSEQSNNFDSTGSFTYNNNLYNYHFNTTTGLIKILNSNQNDALCYIVLYNDNVVRVVGVNLYENIIKDPRTILKQEIENTNIVNIFVQAFTYINDKKTKLKFIKTSDKESSFGTLKEFLIYLEKQYKSSEQVKINEDDVIPSVNENPPVSSTKYNANELSELSEKLTKALQCVKIPYDDTRNIVIKKVVLSGQTTGGKSRRKISTRQIRNIIENSIKFGGDGDGPVNPLDEGAKILAKNLPSSGPPRQRSQKVINPEQPQPVQQQLELEQQNKQQEKEQQVLKQEQEEQEQEEHQIQNKINEIIKNITLPNGLKITRLDIGFELKPTNENIGGGKSTRRRRQTHMKTRKQYKSRN